jgi:hypothetical protein
MEVAVEYTHHMPCYTGYSDTDNRAIPHIVLQPSQLYDLLSPLPNQMIYSARFPIK